MSDVKALEKLEALYVNQLEINKELLEACKEALRFVKTPYIVNPETCEVFDILHLMEQLYRAINKSEGEQHEISIST